MLCYIVTFTLTSLVVYGTIYDMECTRERPPASSNPTTSLVPLFAMLLRYLTNEPCSDLGLILSVFTFRCAKAYSGGLAKQTFYSYNGEPASLAASFWYIQRGVSVCAWCRHLLARGASTS